MSRNALALIDIDSRGQVYQFIKYTIDRKGRKNEMISPYDDQLIGKMVFSVQGEEKSMFFTYAKANEYRNLRFKHSKIVYASMDVTPESEATLRQVCTQFGGYLIADDELTAYWEKIEAVPTVETEVLREAEEEEEAREAAIREAERLEAEARRAEEAGQREDETYTVSKEDMQRNRNTKMPRFEDDMETNLKEVASETEGAEPKKEGERSHNNNRNSYRNRNRSHEDRKDNKGEREGAKGSSESTKQSSEREDGDREAVKYSPQGNVEKFGDNSNHKRRRPHHHHRGHRPKGEGGQSAPSGEA